LSIGNKVLWILNIFGVEVWITQTIFNTWLIMLFLTIIAIIVRLTMSGWKIIPRGFQNAVEAIIDAFDNIVRNIAGEKLIGLGNWFFMVFTFILVSNISGIVGLRPPTADWATTFAFALATFLLIHIMGFRHRKGKYLKSFFEPIFIFFPLNVIGELSKPVSLSFRLFGNVLSGMIVTTLLYTAPIYLRLVVPVVLHVYFDLFTGAIQTYIFCVLSLTFISTAATSTEEV